MVMNILGIHDGHNASVCHLRDGKIVFAIQEERLSREKNHWGTPYKAIDTVQKYSDIKLSDFDSIVFSGREFFGEKISREDFLQQTLNFLGTDRLGMVGTIYGALRGQLANALHPSENRLNRQHNERMDMFLSAFPDILADKIHFIDHHLAHAGAAYYGWNNVGKETLVITADGFGDHVSGTVNVVSNDGEWKELCAITSEDSTHSIAQFYAYITAVMGFMILEHEYKLMGMAPYAKKERSLPICNELKKIFPLVDGKWRYSGPNPIGTEIKKILRFKRFDEICGGLQMFFEETLTDWVRYWINKTGINRICLSGGAFMNVKANMEIMKLNEVEEMFVFPSCGDETNSIGAAYKEHFRLTGERPTPLENFYLGRGFSFQEVEADLNKFKENTDISFEISQVQDISKEVAKRLAQGEVVATFWGREEFGARALGNRSIIADPQNPKVISLINDMIKSRDFWMPFACAMLQEDKDQYIKDFGKIVASYMIMAFPGGPEADKVYAGSHTKDHTIRPQVVKRESNPLFYETIKAFKKITGIGAVLNTSFNLHGHPLVGTPSEALEVFARSGLRVLAFENLVVSKKQKKS